MEYDFQRASMLKRVPAWMLDIILLIVLATGLMAGLSYVLDMDARTSALDDVYTRYEQEFGIEFGITNEQLQQMTEEDLAKYEAASEALSKDAQAQKAFETVLNLILVTVAFGILGAFLILEFLIPLWLKNGQTLGKKCFGVALMRKDGVKVTPFMMFVRTVLGKYTVETMIPVLLLVMLLFGFMGLEGLVLCGAILLAQIIIPFATRNKMAIHDWMACTIAVDLSSQMIFESPEAMEAYHAQMHADKASDAEH